MILPLLFSAITLNPNMAHPTSGPIEGIVESAAISPDSTCKPGQICATHTFNRNGCFFNNFWTSTKGGSPLTIDVTQTGGNGSKVYIYWINSTNKNLNIAGGTASAKYYCP
jgi:hypothetical protein